jgi:hypothetical protein
MKMPTVWDSDEPPYWVKRDKKRTDNWGAYYRQVLIDLGYVQPEPEKPKKEKEKGKKKNGK